MRRRPKINIKQSEKRNFSKLIFKFYCVYVSSAVNGVFNFFIRLSREHLKKTSQNKMWGTNIQKIRKGNNNYQYG